MFGHWEFWVIILAVLLLFGGKRVPELARGLGRAMNEFRRGMRESVDEVSKELDEKSTDGPDNK